MKNFFDGTDNRKNRANSGNVENSESKENAGNGKSAGIGEKAEAPQNVENGVTAGVGEKTEALQNVGNGMMNDDGSVPSGKISFGGSSANAQNDENREKIEHDEKLRRLQQTFFSAYTVDEILKRETIHFQDGFTLISEESQFLPILKNLNSIHFRNTKEEFFKLDFLSEMPGIKSISLINMTVNFRIMKTLLEAPGLEALTLQACKVTPRAFQLLSEAKKIKRLTLNFPIDQETLMKFFPKMNQLEDFIFIPPENTDCFWQIMEMLPNLKAVTVPPGISAPDIEKLVKVYPNLASLNFIDVDLTQETLERLQRLTSLEYLSFMEVRCPKHFKPEFPNLRSLTIANPLNLEEIDFSGVPNLESVHFFQNRNPSCIFTGMKSLSKLKNLHTSIPMREILPSLAGLTTLEELKVIDQSFISPEMMMKISEVPNLKKLTMKHLEQMNDSGFEFLKGLSKLEELNIDTLGEQDFAVLASLPNLRTLTVSSCKRWTPSTFSALSQLQNVRRLRLLEYDPDFLEDLGMIPIRKEKHLNEESDEEFNKKLNEELDEELDEKLNEELDEELDEERLDEEHYASHRKIALSGMKELRICILEHFGILSLDVSDMPKLSYLSVRNSPVRIAKMRNLPRLSHSTFRCCPDLQKLGLTKNVRLKNLNLQDSLKMDPGWIYLPNSLNHLTLSWQHLTDTDTVLECIDELPDLQFLEVRPQSKTQEFCRTGGQLLRDKADFVKQEISKAERIYRKLSQDNSHDWFGAYILPSLQRE